MGNIHSSDIIFATVILQGRQIATLRLSGLRSAAEIILSVRRAVTGAVGLATLKLRNFTQGWSHTGAFRLSPVAEGTQLTLF